MRSSIHVQPLSSAPTLWVIRDRIHFLGQVEGTDLAVVEVDVPPGSGTPTHRHASPEIFRILSGEITFGNFDVEPPEFTVAGPGTVVTVAPNAGHNYQNAGSFPASMSVVLENSMVDFFRELGKSEVPPAAPPSEQEIGEVLAACARHGVTVLGGPPA